MLSNGIQISGIKKEDFIKSNISPSHNITWGKWVNNKIGYMIGYKGNYFRYIYDKEKHYYNFFYTDIMFRNPIYFFKKNNKSLSNIHLGIGYLYNKLNNNSNSICINAGFINEIMINSKINALINLSGIIGWNIYQNNEDILPSLNFGIVYKYNS